MLSAYMYPKKLLDQNWDKVKIPTEEKRMIWFFKHKDSSYFPITQKTEGYVLKCYGHNWGTKADVKP